VGTEKRERQRSNRQLKQQQLAKEQRRRTVTRRAVIIGAAVVGGLALVIGLSWLFSSGGDDSAPSSTPPTSANQGDFAYGTGDCPPENVDQPVRTFDDAPKLCIDPEAAYTATFKTSEGDIVVDLDTATVPGTVNNFVTLARYGYYDDTLIFRTDPSIDIIQGGGKSNADSPGYEIPDEADGFTYEPGQLVMARTAEPNSAGSQWFFVAGPDASSLDEDGKYVVFGHITGGLEVAQNILALAGDDGQTPTREVTVDTVEITQT
jgi:cyclophilin family peptidyl-prolyl cis-trans isomerase